LESQSFGLLLTALEPISHHDPTTGNDSNTLTFNRQKQFVSRVASDTPVLQHLVDALTAQHPMPEPVAELCSRLSLPEWTAVAYIRLLLDIYNHGEGEGLLSGMERYRMLENRLQTAAVRCHTLHRLWSILTSELQLGIQAMQYDAQLVGFWTLPPSLQYQVLIILAEQYRAIVTLARVWHSANKQPGGKLVTATFSVAELPAPPDSIVLDVPAISVNSLRHQLVREPAWLHLCHALGFAPAARGEGEIPIHAEAVFYNGGNIKAGAQQPANAFFLAGEIRKAYPVLDLLGGTTASFDLGESKLKMSAWIVCAENRAALPESLRATPQAQTSVFEMLDNMTHTRQASPGGEGQMIYNYEVLVAGTQVYVELVLTPYTTELTRGALAAALLYYAANSRVIGGQSARGHGRMQMTLLTDMPDGLDAYLAHLDANRERLRAGILDGTLCSGAVVVK